MFVSTGALSDEAVLKGAVLRPVDDQRWGRCDVKAIDLLAAVLAGTRPPRRAEEALLVGPDGTVREGGASNIFAFLNGTLRTHPADNHVLDGVTRRRVLELAMRRPCVEERAFTLSELADGRLRGVANLDTEGRDAGGAGGWPGGG